MWYNSEFKFKITADPEAPNNWIHIWEPVEMPVPVPKTAIPACWGISTISFFKDKLGGVKYWTVENKLNLLGTRWTARQDLGFSCVEPFIQVEDNYYILTGGTVVWVENGERSGWFVQWSAKRARPEYYPKLQHWLDHKDEIEVPA